MAIRTILVIRFSAMGDVLLLVPVMKSLIQACPGLTVTLATRPKFAPFFAGIDGLNVFHADVDVTYRGIRGMRALFKALKRRSDYDMIFDLHDHIRTMILRTFFRISGHRVIVFRKGRKEKKAFVRKNNKITHPLPHTVERYREAFLRAGLAFEIQSGPYLNADVESRRSVSNWLAKLDLKKKEKWIGIAPFAMHVSKIWPLQNYGPLMARLLGKMPVHYFLFGGGESEIKFFLGLKEKFKDQCTLVAGQLKIQDEIALLEHLDLMVCVDSSNMHLAALTHTPLLTIWGGTHPDVGFSPYRYSSVSIEQISRDDLPCRPCSVYGKETCLRGDFACLNWIAEELISSEILNRLKN